MDHRRPQEIPQYAASGRERLRQLANHVEELAPINLSLTHWYSGGKGCAVGWVAANAPWFQAQGLHLRFEESLKDCCPVYENATEWEAVSKFFEIETSEAKQLFKRGAYGGNITPDPKVMAAKIRQFLAKKHSLAAVA